MERDSAKYAYQIRHLCLDDFYFGSLRKIATVKQHLVHGLVDDLYLSQAISLQWARDINAQCGQPLLDTTTGKEYDWTHPYYLTILSQYWNNVIHRGIHVITSIY